MVNLQNIQMKSGSNFTIVCPFPVGCVYMSSTNTSPAFVFGGIWKRVRRRHLFPISYNSTPAGGSTGGSWTQTLHHWHISGDLVARFDPMYLSGGTNYMVWKYKASPTSGNWYYTSYNTIPSGYNEHQDS